MKESSSLTLDIPGNETENDPLHHLSNSCPKVHTACNCT